MSLPSLLLRQSSSSLPRLHRGRVSWQAKWEKDKVFRTVLLQHTCALGR